MSCACEHFQRPQDVCRNLSMSMFPWFLWKFFGLAVSVGGCERQCLTVCEVTLIFNVSLHYSIGMRVSHAPTGRFGNSVRKWTNKGVYSPWDRERREREVLQKGKGRSFPRLSYHSDRQSQCVYEYLTGCFGFSSHVLSEGLRRLAVFWLACSCWTEDWVSGELL